jgi:hypothetical protein
VLEQVVAAVFEAFDLGKGECFGGHLDILVFVIGLFTIVLFFLLLDVNTCLYAFFNKELTGKSFMTAFGFKVSITVVFFL